MPVGDPPPNAPAPTGPQGWECPRCHAIYAPWVASCGECKPPEQSLRQRIQEAQPPVVLPVAPYTPPVYPAPLFPAPAWPYQDRIVWCGPLPVAPADWVRATMGSGAGTGQAFTVNLSGQVAPAEDVASTLRDMTRRNADHTLERYRQHARDEDDDGTAGVPAEV